MAGSTIGSKVTTGITLGNTAGPGVYISPLTITPTGYVDPANYGVAGLTGSIGSAYVLNQGTISGGIGKQGAAGSAGDAGGGGVGLTAGSLINNGTVAGGSGGAGEAGGGRGGYGIDLVGALLINTGLIAGGHGGYGFRIGEGDGGTGAILESSILVNAGTITGGTGSAGYGNSGIGVVLDNGSLVNQGLIAGGAAGSGSNGYSGGIGAAVYAGNLTNTGTISGGSGSRGDGAVGLMIAGGSAVNHGVISGGTGGGNEVGLVAGGAGAALSGGSLTNDGVISGGKGGYAKFHSGPPGAGVTVSGGALTNHGTIFGANGAPGFRGSGSGGVGVDLSAGTLINDGTIAGGYPFIIGPGLRYQAYGGVGVNFRNGGTLIDGGFITGGTSAAATADAVDFGNGASRLILDGRAVFIGAVVANAAYSNVLELTSDTGAGTITGLGNAVRGFQTVTIDQRASWFVSGNVAGLASGQTIDGFTVHDTIELTGISITGLSYSGGILTLTAAGGAATVDLPGNFTTSDFIVSNVAAGADITVVCFRAGTRIRIDGGNVPVERLHVGDSVLVLTDDGRLVPRPIVWIGYRSVDCRRHPTPHLVWPVRIRAGTFGHGVPCRDLFLSPDHGVFLDSVLIPVKHLINGDRIEQVPVDEVIYFHIEMQTHSVLLAEDLATESYLDTGDRGKFAAGGQPLTMFPDFATRMWEAMGCAPLVISGPKLDAARRRISQSVHQPGAAESQVRTVSAHPRPRNLRVE
jgi:hypothetical protein